MLLPDSVSRDGVRKLLRGEQVPLWKAVMPAVHAGAQMGQLCPRAQPLFNHRAMNPPRRLEGVVGGTSLPPSITIQYLMSTQGLGEISLCVPCPTCKQGLTPLQPWQHQLPDPGSASLSTPTPCPDLDSLLPQRLGLRGGRWVDPA